MFFLYCVRVHTMIFHKCFVAITTKIFTVGATFREKERRTKVCILEDTNKRQCNAYRRSSCNAACTCNRSRCTQVFHGSPFSVCSESRPSPNLLNDCHAFRCRQWRCVTVNRKYFLLCPLILDKKIRLTYPNVNAPASKNRARPFSTFILFFRLSV